MTHAELVEQVARIIAPGIFDREDGVRYPLTGQEVRKKATAAIAAIHAALQEPIWMNDGDYVGHTPRQAWRTMIDRSPLKEVDG